MTQRIQTATRGGAIPALLTLPVLTALILSMGLAPTARAAGARLYKSGPVQITADGSALWVVNPDNDSVTRISLPSEAVLEIPLPDPGVRHSPLGLAVTDDGAEVWVACRDSDRVYVLRGSDGAELARIDLPWGTGPYSVVLAPPAGTPGTQDFALVTGFRAGSLPVLDTATRSVSRILAPVFHSPHGAAFADDGSAWVTHLFADGEHSRLTRVDFSDPADPEVTSKVRITAVNPQRSSQTAPRPAEGGYLTLRGHPGQVPAGGDAGRLWVPVQYENIHEDSPSPDSTVQAVIRKVDLGRRLWVEGSNLPSNPQHPAKVILSAVAVHDPTSGTPIYDGPGWDAGVSGPVDLAFSADGALAYIVFEHSENVLVVPTATEPVKPAAAPALTEISVGRRPMGIALAPAGNLAYVSNVLSRSVSVVDLAAGSELRQIAVTPTTGEPFSPGRLRGAQIFHSSDEDAISLNRKVACASCHVNGEHDGRGWDLQHLPGPHGPRSTTTLAGAGATYGPPDPTTGWGQLHRSGDRDEVQDFEHTFQGLQMGGNGFLGGAVQPELGPANAGLDADLDSLAGYVLSLAPPARSPHRESGGALNPAALRGATFFKGSDAAKPADGQCAVCHDPSQGFSDRAFHDVGQMVLPGEQELNNRVPLNHVNTPGLVGLWTTPPYDGASTWTETLMQALLNFQNRGPGPAPHGRLGGLTGRQLRDLREFLLSLDGDTTAAEVTAAVDLAPPSIVRLSPTAAGRVEVWFDESIEAASAETLAAWRLTRVPGGETVTILSAALDSQNGDRLTLTFTPPAGACAQEHYELSPVGPILDLADTASGGVANALTNGPAIPFAIGPELTITLGASGYENLTVAVHDAATLSGLTQWSHGSNWLFPTSGGGGSNTGFVRFDWSAPFQAATGVASSAALVEARIELHPSHGDSQIIEARRVLQEWFDHRGGDFNGNPGDPGSGHGGPTWRDAEHPNRRWNQSNARARTAGVEGDDPGDYHGGDDTAFTPDATVVMAAINKPLEITGSRVDDAFRFWFDHPTLDHGYALRVRPSSIHEVRFEATDHELGDEGPVLRITYRMPGACGEMFTDGFEVGDASRWTLSVP